MLTEARQIFIREKVPATALSSHGLGRKKFSSPNGRMIVALQSSAMSAILIFCFINACCHIGKQLYGERKYKSTEHQISVFAKSEKKPEVVLLGSSLIRIPFYVCDIQHSHPSLYEDYCWNNTLQDLLTPTKKHSVFNFAIDGSMISDAFLVQSKFLTKNCAPKWIVYGVAPRDFLDNYVSKETRTPLFDRLFDVQDILFAKAPFKIAPAEKFDLIIEKICWLYRCRSDVQQHLTNRIQRILQDEAFYVRNKNVTDTSFFRKESSIKNLRNYQKRYQTFIKEKFHRQKDFLDALCEQSIKNGTKILLVNMPLPNKITNLIPQSAYTLYQRTLENAARMPGVYLLDLQHSKHFPGYLFGDLVHLNGEGGYLLNLFIAQKLLEIDRNHTKHDSLLKARIGKKIVNLSSSYGKATDALATWWLTKSYFDEPQVPEVVVLGDSQLWPVLGADAYVYRKPIDLVTYHRSKVLEYQIHTLIKKNCRVFVGATPRALVSDQLAICQALFSGKHKPKIVALNLSPINFVDANSYDPKATEAFTFFSTTRDVNQLAKNLDKLKMLKHRSPTSYDYDSLFKAAFGLGVPFERLAPGENIICGLENYPYEDHTAEYEKRYSNPLAPRFYEQMSALEALIKFLNSKHIKVIVFSNPSFASNKVFLPEPFWGYYNTKISQICSNNAADYVDAEKTILPFNKDELFDNLHLNLSGGLRWTRCLAVYISNKLQPGSLQKLFALSKYLK